MHQLTILIFETTMISATNTTAILKHLKGKWPVSHSMKSVYSLEPITYEMAEKFSDLPQFDAITAHINLI